MNNSIKYLIESELNETLSNIYEYDPYAVFVVDNDLEKIQYFTCSENLSFMNGQIWYQGGFTNEQEELVSDFVYNNVQNLKLNECAVIKNKQNRQNYTVYVIKQN